MARLGYLLDDLQVDAEEGLPVERLIPGWQARWHARPWPGWAARLSGRGGRDRARTCDLGVVSAALSPPELHARCVPDARAGTSRGCHRPPRSESAAAELVSGAARGRGG